jgi:CDP-diacylglycerol---serine O-phosphatidyltransferase
MRPLRTIAVFPTLLTLGNLVCGFFAIVVAARVDKPPNLETLERTIAADTANVMISGWLIFLAIIFDGLDGYVARLSKTSSDFGAQLDSLSDLVTFGVAPGFMLVKMCPQFTIVHNYTIWIIATLYVICAALRLARFNVETSDEDDHLKFNGLPSPSAAAAIAGFAIMFFFLRDKNESLLETRQWIDRILQHTLPYFGVLLALLMVSRIPYPHVTNQIFRGQRSFAHVVGVVFALMAVMLFRGYAIPLVFSMFILYGPAHWAWQKFVRHHKEEEPLF